MSNKATHAEWVQRKELNRCDIQVKPESAIRLHSSTETPKHLVVKALLARELQRNGRPFDTEVKIGDVGRVDVLDFGEFDEAPIVYEVETGVTPKKAKAKANQYAVGPIRDVIILDPTEAPDDVAGIVDWLRAEVAGI